jgi:poly-beta-1,6-N-acetyl-D-glucosamine synthase
MNGFLRFLLGRERPLPAKNFFPEVTVLIPAYNEEACIADTIKSVIEQSYFVSEIIVIDDCSSDKTGEIARSFPAVEVLRTDKNVGSKSRALNYALPNVDTEIVIFIDADTTLHVDAIKRAVRHFQHDNVGMVCGFVATKNDTCIWERSRIAEYLVGCGIKKAGLDNADAVIVASGCFLSARTELVRKLGGFKERTLAEDMDLTWEAIEAGYSIRHDLTAICYVVDPPNYSIYDKQMSRWMQGFWQCMKVRNSNPFQKSWKLGIVVATNIILSFTGPLFLIWGLYYFGWQTIGIVFGSHFLINVIPNIYYGRKLGYRNGTIIIGTIELFFIQFLNTYIFFRSFINEYFLGKHLVHWEKGH